MAIEQDAVVSIEDRIFDRLTETEATDEQKPTEEVKEDQTASEEQQEPTNEQEVVAEEEEDKELKAEETEVEVDEGEEESDEPWMPENLNELAEAMSVELDDLKSIRVQTKVNGIEGEATLADVIKNYQINKSLTEKSEAFAKERKLFEEQQVELKKAYESKLDQAENMVKAAETRLIQEVESIDWATLRQEDPTDYAIKRQDYMEKIGEIEALKQKTATEREEQQQAQAEEQRAEFQKVLEYNVQQLNTVIPEWHNPDVRTKELKELKDYLISKAGISEDEVNGIYDYRFISLARKAREYDKIQANAKPAKARAKKVPKFTKPGTQKTAADKKANSDDKLRSKLRKSGSVKDTAAVLLERL